MYMQVVLWQVHELLQSHCGGNREGTLFSLLHIHYTHLASVRLYIYICICKWLCGKCMSCLW